MKHYKTEKPLTVEEERELFAQLEGKSLRQLAITRIVNANMGMVIQLAKKHLAPGIELEDLIQEGALGLMEAIEKFDITRGVRFNTFAHWLVRATMIEYIQNNGLVRIPRQTQYIKTVIEKLRQGLGRKPTPKEVLKKLIGPKRALPSVEFIEHLINFENQDFTPPNYVQFVYDSIDWQVDHIVDESHKPEKTEAKIDVEKLLSMLPEKYQKILRLYFCCGMAGRPFTLKEIGKEFGVSKKIIWQDITKSIKTMRQSIV